MAESLEALDRRLAMNDLRFELAPSSASWSLSAQPLPNIEAAKNRSSLALANHRRPSHSDAKWSSHASHPRLSWLFLVPANQNPHKYWVLCFFSTGCGIKITPAISQNIFT